VVTECVDSCARLVNGLAAHAAGMTPLQWKVLHDQHAELISGTVKLPVGNVTVDPNDVKAKIHCVLKVAANCAAISVCESRSCRQQICAL
jgi:hypothetical protein